MQPRVWEWLLCRCCCCWAASVVADSVRPHRRQPPRLPRPWDSPGKNTGVGCHFLLQCMKVKSESEAAQSCPTLSDPMDYTAYQAPPSMGFSRQEYWSGVPSPSPWACDWYLKCVCVCCGVGRGKKSGRTKLLPCKVWCSLLVDSVTIEWILRHIAVSENCLWLWGIAPPTLEVESQENNLFTIIQACFNVPDFLIWSLDTSS